MATILAISSQVARGTVGLSVIVPALQALGHEVIALPTILLSNHPGHARFAGERVAPALLERMIDALAINGWLNQVQAVTTGYLPSAAHVSIARATVDELRRRVRNLPYLCDPVLGDDPKGLYIEQSAAEAVRRDLVPRATVITPNCFEYGFLAGTKVASHLDVPGIRDPAALGTLVVAKSLPGRSSSELANVACASGILLGTAYIPRRPHPAHGTGDLLAALVLAALLEGTPATAALGLATAVLDQTIATSATRDQLSLTALPRRLADVRPWPVELNGAAGPMGWTLPSARPA